MKLKVGDNVRVMVGKDKGKSGKITHTFKNENKVIIEGINLVKKHVGNPACFLIFRGIFEDFYFVK